MTPKNDPIDLPADASPLDFAFKIHDGIGQKAIMAKVNGKTVELGYKLQNGDVVEILTSKNQTPKRGWLEIVRTADAARKIRRILRHRGEMIGAGARV